METDKRYNVRSGAETGRYYVISERTGVRYTVEPIGNDRTATGDFMVKKGWGKYTGAIDESESIITKENGYDKIYYTGIGCSPTSLIEKLDAEYPDKPKDSIEKYLTNGVFEPGNALSIILIEQMEKEEKINNEIKNIEENEN